MRIICPLLIASFSAVGASESAQPWLGLDLSLTWASQYMAHGMTVSDTAHIQPQIVATLGESGFYLKHWASIPIDSDHRNADEHDSIIGYGHDLAADSRYATNIHGYVDYW
ncbi:MAG: hypothetical protein ACYTF0_05845 [Planctomycetota bacterium]|jgi:hypothetical protein